MKKLRVHNNVIRIKSEGAGKLLMGFRQEHVIDILKISQTWNIGKVVTVGQD